MLWEELNWAEFQGLVPETYDTAILPVGTVEAHGVSPLGTDNLIPLEIARRISGELNAIIAPPVNHGITSSLLGYAGSLTVSKETFENYVRELLISIGQWQFAKIVIINGHGGQIEELGRAAKAAWQETRKKIAVIHWWMCCDDIVERIYGRAGGHAATDENAAVQAFRPDLIKKDMYSDDMVYNQPKGFVTYPNAGTILAYKDFAGYLDFDQNKAEEYFKSAVDRVRGHILDIFRRWERL